jgi:hypothetical protein
MRKTKNSSLSVVKSDVSFAAYATAARHVTAACYLLATLPMRYLLGSLIWFKSLFSVDRYTPASYKGLVSRHAQLGAINSLPHDYFRSLYFELTEIYGLQTVDFRGVLSDGNLTDISAEFDCYEVVHEEGTLASGHHDLVIYEIDVKNPELSILASIIHLFSSTKQGALVKSVLLVPVVHVDKANENVNISALTNRIYDTYSALLSKSQVQHMIYEYRLTLGEPLHRQNNLVSHGVMVRQCAEDIAQLRDAMPLRDYSLITSEFDKHAHLFNDKRLPSILPNDESK